MKNQVENKDSRRKFLIQWTVPIVLTALITLLKFNPQWIEKYYSMGFYAAYARFLRAISGAFHISLGDIAYILLCLYALYLLFRLLKAFFTKQLSWKKTAAYTLKVVRVFLWLYIVFNVIWGLNYYRRGIAEQLGLDAGHYSKEEVENITCELIDKVNESRRVLSHDTLTDETVKDIFIKSRIAYDSAAKEYSFLSYHPGSVKESIFSPVAKYMGFIGYYNPFSGEAQVRNNIPHILLPYTACHEMAHQLGYASESEANFVGYLAARKSEDPYFLYSVYMDLYKYASTELFMKDFFTTHSWELDSLVKADFRAINRFFYKEQNKLSPVVMSWYDQYLKANKQSNGIDSYNEVISWLIAYKKKFGEI